LLEFNQYSKTVASVVVRPLEHIDRVNLDIAQMLNSLQDRCFSETKR
jgi:hypothetical protein